MWNAACAPYSASAKVINGSGEIEEYVGRHPVRAGEVMVEHPGRFVCDAGPGTSVWGAGFRVWRRTKISKGGPLYFLLPMDMLFSVLTEEEVEALVSRAAAKSYFGRRIFPALSEFRLPRAELESRVNEYCSAPEVMRGRVWWIGGTART